MAHTAVHDGYRHVQILLCVDMSSIMKILNKFQGKGPWVFYVLKSCLFDGRNEAVVDEEFWR